MLTITLAIIKLLPLHPSYVYRAMAIPTAAMAPMAPANGVAIGAASSPSPVEVASPPLVVSSPPPPLPPVVSVAVSVAAVVVSAVVVTVVVSVPDEELEVGEVTVSVLTETETEGETETLMVLYDISIDWMEGKVVQGGSLRGLIAGGHGDCLSGG